MTTKFDELIAKLKEIFQIDKPELDFGIYKIYVLLEIQNGGDRPRVAPRAACPQYHPVG